MSLTALEEELLRKSESLTLLVRLFCHARRTGYVFTDKEVDAIEDVAMLHSGFINNVPLGNV